MLEMLEKINGIVWGLPTVGLILTVGIVLSIRTGFAQLRLFPQAIRKLTAPEIIPRLKIFAQTLAEQIAHPAGGTVYVFGNINFIVPLLRITCVAVPAGNVMEIVPDRTKCKPPSSGQRTVQ